MLCSVEGLTCSECIPRNDTASELERIAGLKARKGCTERAPFPQYGDFETGENFYRCPVSMLTSEAIAIVEVLIMTELGFLPLAGGFLDQPASLITRLRVARNYKQKLLDFKKDKK